jgi:hypothetical protein
MVPASVELALMILLTDHEGLSEPNRDDALPASLSVVSLSVRSGRRSF